MLKSEQSVYVSAFENRLMHGLLNSYGTIEFRCLGIFFNLTHLFYVSR